MRHTYAAILLAATLSLTIVHAVSNREELINAAIQEVLSAESHAAAQHSSTSGAHRSSEQLLHAFKRASKASIEQGKARVRFEKMVHRAERKIMDNKRKEIDQTDNLAKAEQIARELIHTPGKVLTKQEVARIYQEAECKMTHVSCKRNQTYRTVTGVCNNLKNPLLGSSRTPFRRLIAPQYEDGISQLRGTMQSQETPLVTQGPFSPPNPSPRIVTVSVVQDQPIVNNDVSHMLMQWGQFIDHDLDLAAAFKDECSGCEVNETCVPIRVPTSDQTFGDSSQSQVCNPFPRSIPVCDPKAGDGKVEPREQLNELNSFIDGSQIYGSSDEVFEAVREENSALLRTGRNIPANGGGGPSLPIDTDNFVDCMGATGCFLAGDVRVNEHTALTVMHTIWLREHNRIARSLQTMNPSWTNEKVFQVSRAIVGAEIQKITYKDYLPIVLGSALSLTGPYTSYKPDVNPTIPNAFAAAAFRFGHSQIQPSFDRLNEAYESEDNGPLKLADAFFDPSQYENSEGTDPLLRGLLFNSARRVDEFVIDVLTNHLFQTDSSVGMDLSALNIQRGRDHGLPPYLTWKRWAERECNISSDFQSDLTQVHLLQTYGTLETVDLWVGGLAEERVPRGLVGATFACIFAKTFQAIRDGDRFYYENSDSNALFNAQQRAAIENASLSRIVCDNGDNINRVPRNAFRPAGEDEEPIPCSAIPKVDLRAWGNGSDSQDCYLKTRVNNQRRDVNLYSYSKVGYHGNHEIYKTSIEKSNNAATHCLPIVCPPSDNSDVRVGVAEYRKNQRMLCMIDKNSLLPGKLLKSRTVYVGLLPASTFQDPSTGVYNGLDACNTGGAVALTFNCNGDIVSEDEVLLQDLEAALSNIDDVSSYQQNNDVTEKITETSMDDVPDDIKTLLESPASDEEALASNEPWKMKTIDLLENLLDELKENKGIAQKKD